MKKMIIISLLAITIIFIAGCVQEQDNITFKFKESCLGSDIEPFEFTVDIDLPLDKEEAYIVFKTAYDERFPNFPQDVNHPVQIEYIENIDGNWVLYEGGTPTQIFWNIDIEKMEVIRGCV